MVVRGALWVLIWSVSITLLQAMTTPKNWAVPLVVAQNKPRTLGLSIQKNSTLLAKSPKSSQCSAMCKTVLQERLFVQAVKNLDSVAIDTIISKIGESINAASVEAEHKDVDTPMVRRVHDVRCDRKSKKEALRNIRRLFSLKIDGDLNALQYCVVQIKQRPTVAYLCLDALLAYNVGSFAVTSSGATLLHLAVKTGDLETVQLILVATKIPVDAGDRAGMTALHYACSLPRSVRSATDIITTLLAAGASLEATDNEQRTPVMFACAAGNWATVNHLAIIGADLSVSDKQLRTLLHYLVGCDTEYFQDGELYRKANPEGYERDISQRIHIIKDLVGYQTLLLDDAEGHDPEEVALDHNHRALYDELHKIFGQMGKDEQRAAEDGVNGHSIELHSIVADAA